MVVNDPLAENQRIRSTAASANKITRNRKAPGSSNINNRNQNNTDADKYLSPGVAKKIRQAKQASDSGGWVAKPSKRPLYIIFQKLIQIVLIFIEQRPIQMIL